MKVIQNISNNSISFNISEINKLSNPKAYLYELLKEYRFTEWNDVYNLLEAQSGKQVFSKTHRLLKDRDCLLLSDIDSNTLLSESEESIIITDADKDINTPFGTLSFNEVAKFQKNDIRTIHVDKALLKFPVTIRQWQKGDYFYPFGMKGKKKLSKFFKDEKLSLIDKEKVWLLYSGDDIVWVINRRQDERFKVTENTKSIIKIELK